MRTGLLLISGAAGIVLNLSAPALADAGSSMMLGRGLHLIYGNAVFGAIEGLLIALVLKASWRRAIPIMIAANYASGILGLAIPWGHGGDVYRQILVEGASDAALAGAQSQVIELGLMAFVVTVVIEWPFCFWALKGVGHRLRKSVLGSALVQIPTYAVMVAWVATMASDDLFTSVEIDPSLVSRTGPCATVYFVSPDDGDVYQVALNGSGRKKVMALGLDDGYADLFLKQHGKGAPWQLSLSRGQQTTTIVPDVKLRSAPEGVYRSERVDGEKAVTEIHNRGPYATPLDYRLAGRRDWAIRIQWWSGVYASNGKTGEELRIGLDTPLATWAAQYGTVLPGDLVVFEMGGQILLLDLNGRRLGLVTPGRCPTVIPHESPTTMASHPASRSANP